MTEAEQVRAKRFVCRILPNEKEEYGDQQLGTLKVLRCEHLLALCDVSLLVVHIFCFDDFLIQG